MSSQSFITAQPGFYTLAGMGPLTIQIENGSGVLVIQNATQPDLSGTLPSSAVTGTTSQDFTVAQNVWVMPIPGAVSTACTISISYDVGNTAGSAQTLITGSTLPTNAAQEAGGHLAAIDAKTPALGIALAAGSVPVVLTATQLASLITPTIQNTGFVATQATASALNATVVGTGTFSVQVSSIPNVTLATTGTGATPPIVGTVSSEDIALASIVDSSNALYVYFCEALPGALTSAAAWRCSRLTVATGQLMWANLSTGTGAMGSFKDIADNRAALTYA